MSNTAEKYALTIPAHDVTSEVIDADKLTISPNAQRDLDEARVKKLAAGYVPSAVGTLVVSQRDGVNYIIDGQHRYKAGVQAGQTSFRCEVHRGLTLKDEAALFLIINQESKRVASVDTYRVGLTAQIPLYVWTETVLASRGLRAGGGGVDSVRAIGTILRITRVYGAEVLAKTLDTAEYAFGRHDGTFDWQILSALGLFFHHHPDVPIAELGTKLKRRGLADTWMQFFAAEAAAQGIRHSGTDARAKAGYRVLLREWNRKRTANRLTSALKEV